MKSWTFGVFGAYVFVMCLTGSTTHGEGEKPGETITAQNILLHGLRGTYFVPNHGQWEDADVTYGLKSNGLNVAFRQSSFTMYLRRQIATLPDNEGGLSSEQVEYESLMLSVSFPGSNAIEPQGTNELPTRFNYFIGNDESKWADSVPSYGSVVYENLYDGIDLVICGNDDGVLKYEFRCDPGTDYSPITIRYDGLNGPLCVDSSTGDLLIETSLGTLRDTAPIAWQPGQGDFNPPDDDNKETDTLDASFSVLDDHTYSFTLTTPIDPSLPLVIDPDVHWLMYLGGSNSDEATCVATNEDGDMYVAGNTWSDDVYRDWNSRKGGQDAFVVKINASNWVEWTTYLGGSDDETTSAIATDSAGNPVVVGTTQSSDFAFRSFRSYGSPDGFIVVFGDYGDVRRMRYVGGSGNEDCCGIALDSAGYIYLTGQTSSAVWGGRLNSIHGGGIDTYLSRHNSDGELLWMRYLGGTEPDYGSAVAVNELDEVYVAGTTTSDDFEGRVNSIHGRTDAYLLKATTAGQLEWMTYLGGSRNETPHAIKASSPDTLYLTGSTTSYDFEGSNNSIHDPLGDAFVLKASTDGDVDWMTYLGGTNKDDGLDLAVDDHGIICVVGGTWSRLIDGRINAHHGLSDAFITLLSPSGRHGKTVYLGGGESDIGYGMAIRAPGQLLVAGTTRSPDLEGAVSHYRGHGDGFVANIRYVSGPDLAVLTSCSDDRPFRVTWDGATPGGPVMLVLARCPGNAPLPSQSPCEGTPLSVCSQKVRWSRQFQSDANGAGNLSTIARDDVCGCYVQLVDLTTCQTSNVVRIE